MAKAAETAANRKAEATSAFYSKLEEAAASYSKPSSLQKRKSTT